MSKSEVIRCLKRYVAREVLLRPKETPRGWFAAWIDIYRSIIFCWPVSQDAFAERRQPNVSRSTRPHRPLYLRRLQPWLPQRVQGTSWPIRCKTARTTKVFRTKLAGHRPQDYFRYASCRPGDSLNKPP